MYDSLSNGKFVKVHDQQETCDLKEHFYAPTYTTFKALLGQKDSKVPWDIQFPTVNCLGRL